MKTNHIQTLRTAYCLWLNNIVRIKGTPHIDVVCARCPYMRGNGQGHGIECYWTSDPAPDAPDVVINPEPEMLATRGRLAIAEGAEKGPSDPASPAFKRRKKALIRQLRKAAYAFGT